MRTIGKLQQHLGAYSPALNNILNPNPYSVRLREDYSTESAFIPPGPSQKYDGHHLYSYRKENLVNASKMYENEKEHRLMKFVNSKMRLHQASHSTDIRAYPDSNE
jgi:hypothetical protein